MPTHNTKDFSLRASMIRPFFLVVFDGNHPKVLVAYFSLACRSILQKHKLVIPVFFPALYLITKMAYVGSA